MQKGERMAKNNIMIFCVIFLYLLRIPFAQDFVGRNHYIGTIGKGNRVYVDLKIEKDSIMGYYFYYRTGIPVDLKGNINPDKSFRIDEYINRDLTGIFIGELKGFDKLIGQWSSPDAKKTLRFELIKIAESKEYKSDRYDVRVAYPQFRIDNKSLEQKLNDTIKTVTHNVYNNFMQDIEDYISPESVLPFFYTDYRIEYFSGQIVSLLFTHSEYTGGVHPNYYYTTINLFLAPDKIKGLTLDDLFIKNSNYLRLLSDICITNLKSQGATFVIDEEVKDVSEQLDAFSITPKELVFTFSPYLVGSYAEGTYTVAIPYKDIKKIINPNGPLGEIITF